MDFGTSLKDKKSQVAIALFIVLAWSCWEWRCCAAYNPSPLAKALFSAINIITIGNSLESGDNSSLSLKGLRFASNLVIIEKTQEASQLIEMLLRIERLRADSKCDIHNISRIFLVYRDIDRKNQLSANEWKSLSKPIRSEAEKIYEYYKKVVPKPASINDESIASIFKILSERYEDHKCLNEAIECQLAAINAEKETQRENSTLYHTLLYQLAVLYHKNNMDKEAINVINQTVALPEGITAIGTTDMLFKKEHIRRCKELLRSLRNSIAMQMMSSIEITRLTL